MSIETKLHISNLLLCFFLGMFANDITRWLELTGGMKLWAGLGLSLLFSFNAVVFLSP